MTFSIAKLDVAKRDASLPRRAARPTIWLLSLLLASSVAQGQQVSSKSAASSRPTPPVEHTEPPSPFHITGIIINSTTKAPIANAELTAETMNSGNADGRRGKRRSSRQSSGQSYIATSDAAGHFQIDLPSAGGWSLNASARGYHGQALDEHNGYSTGVVLTDAAPVFDVLFALPPAATIEGFVLDEAGEAVRNGQVSLSWLPPAAPDNPHPKPQNRGQQQTDDRGYYKFSEVQPGSYELRVQAQPWYATGANGGFAQIGGSSFRDAPAGAAAFDVVYPVMWYPGATDHDAAAPIVLHAGDTREADFRLLPMAGFHLHVPPGQLTLFSDGRRETRPSQTIAYVSQLLPDGTDTVIQTSTRMDPSGNLEVDGLSIGTYQVHLQNEPSPNGSSAAKIQIGSNSARTLELSQAVQASKVAIKVEPDTDIEGLQVAFIDTGTNSVTYANRPGEQRQRGGMRRRPGGPDAPETPAEERSGWSTALQPGTYEVTLNGVRDLRLASIEASGATATGRTVTIGGGSAVLTLHVAKGRGTVEGTVRLHGKPDAGAMVLLIPAGLGNPAEIDIPRRDQSNSDGSFELAAVLPGKYILVAIDHGWDVNWADSATLRHFLMQGMPLNVAPPDGQHSTYTEAIEAQLP